MQQKQGTEQRILSFPLWAAFLNPVPFDSNKNLQPEPWKKELFTLIIYKYQQ